MKGLGFFTFGGVLSSVNFFLVFIAKDEIQGLGSPLPPMGRSNHVSSLS